MQLPQFAPDAEAVPPPADTLYPLYEADAPPPPALLVAAPPLPAVAADAPDALADDTETVVGPA